MPSSGRWSRYHWARNSTRTRRCFRAGWSGCRADNRRRSQVLLQGPESVPCPGIEFDRLQSTGTNCRQIHFASGESGNGRWRGIPSEIANGVAQYYPDVNISAVRLAMGVNTVHGQAITIGNDIFFPRELDLSTKGDQQFLFHELEHVGQYARRGGVRPFLAEYIAKIPGKVIANRSFEIHDDIDIERAAIG